MTLTMMMIGFKTSPPVARARKKEVKKLARASLQSVGEDVAWMVTRARYRPTLTHSTWGPSPLQRPRCHSSCQVQSPSVHVFSSCRGRTDRCLYFYLTITQHVSENRPSGY